MNDVTIGNPQGTVTANEIGWLAGIIDGEGTIVLFLMQKNGVLQGVTPQVIMANTDKELVDKYADILKRANVGGYYSKRKQNNVYGLVADQRKDKKYKDLYRVNTTGYLRVKKLLELVQDDLVGDKQRRAKTLLKLINYRLSRSTAEGKTVIGRMAPYEYQDLLLIKEFCILMNSKHEHLVDGLLRDHERKQRLAV